MSGLTLFHQFPVDIHWRIAMRFSAIEFAALLQVSRAVYLLFTEVHVRIARDERNGMMVHSPHIALNAMQIAEEWGQLTPRESRALRMDLARSPVVFYAGIIDPAMLVLGEAFLAVRHNPAALSDLALGQLNLRQGAILARQICDENVQAATISTIGVRAIQENLPKNKLLELISKFSIYANNITKTLCRLLITSNITIEQLEEMMRIISCPKKRDRILRTLARQNGIEIYTAILIAHLIENPLKREATLCEIAWKDLIKKTFRHGGA
jgi:hypothetical protein